MAHSNIHTDRTSNHLDNHSDQSGVHIDRHDNTPHQNNHNDNPEFHNNLHIDGHSDLHINYTIDFLAIHEDTHLNIARESRHFDLTTPHSDVHNNVDHKDNHSNIPDTHLNVHNDDSGGHIAVHSNISGIIEPLDHNDISIIHNYVSVVLPSLQVKQNNLQLIYPDRQVHDSQYVSQQFSVDRSIAKFSGTLYIAETNDLDLARQVERFITDFQDIHSIADFPLHRRTIGGDDPINESVAIVSSCMESDDRIICILSSNFTEDDRFNSDGTLIRYGLAVGMYVRVGNRLLSITERPSLNQIVFAPNIHVENGSEIHQAFTVRAQMDHSRNIRMTSIPDWYGPWEIPWIEVP